MAAIAWTDVMNVPGATADGFGTLSAGWQTMALAVANTQLDPDMFDGEDGPITLMARAMLACHYSVLGRRGMYGNVISESEGGVSQGFAVPPLTKSSLLSTGYGQAILLLLNSAAGGATVL